MGGEVNSGVVWRCCLWTGPPLIPGCDCYTRVPADDCGTDRGRGNLNRFRNLLIYLNFYFLYYWLEYYLEYRLASTML